jgi:hypothetical protein
MDSSCYKNESYKRRNNEMLTRYIANRAFVLAESSGPLTYTAKFLIWLLSMNKLKTTT